MTEPNIKSPAIDAKVSEVLIGTLSCKWIDPIVCPPPYHVEFFGLQFANGDYQVNHCVLDGENDSVLKELQGWWPSPPLPKAAVDGFIPHDQSIGRKAIAGLKAWLRLYPDR